MGTFGRYVGEVIIPDNMKEEFCASMLKLLQCGGMMQFEKVSLYGKEIALISPVEPDESGKVSFFYNYMGDELWEDAVFYMDNLHLISGKIGEAEFGNVMTACHLLYEFFSKSYGYANINGDIVNQRRYIGWINHILDTDFSFGRRFNIWKYIETYYIEYLGNEHFQEMDPQIAFEIVPKGLELFSGGRDLADIFYCAKGTESLEREEIREGTYPSEIIKVRHELKALYQKYGSTEKYAVWNMLTIPREERQKITAEKYRWIAEATLRLPARVFAYISAELLELDFWGEWKTIYDKVYTDEICLEYVDEQIVNERTKVQTQSIPAIKTKDFLKEDGYFVFYNTPNEIKDKPNYYISDDDLLFWWDESGKVEISEKMDTQLIEWAEEYHEIEQGIMDEEVGQYDMLKQLLDILDQATENYRRIYAFKSLFYEFVQNNKDKRYIAAVRLFETVLKDNWEEGKIIKTCRQSWDMCSKNVTFNQGRVTVKRYLAAMANTQLRMRYFGF